MSEDARFEDGREAPLYLGAEDAEALQVISALCQDAVFPVTEMRWQVRQHRFAILLNRFRWEDKAGAGQPPERVQSLFVVDHTLAVSSQGIDRTDGDLILSVLAISFEPGEEGAGNLFMTLAGDGVIKLSVEALEVSLKDVTRPYVAPSGKVPDHKL